METRTAPAEGAGEERIMESKENSRDDLSQASRAYLMACAAGAVVCFSLAMASHVYADLCGFVAGAASFAVFGLVGCDVIERLGGRG